MMPDRNTDRLDTIHKAVVRIRKILTQIVWCVFIALSIWHMLSTLTPVHPIVA